VSREALRFLILPGLGGSGPTHWQTRWEGSDPAFERIQQSDWNCPRLEAWLSAVDDAVAKTRGPIVLVAHSLACVLVAHGARLGRWRNVTAALLVAPADVDSEAHTPPETRNFAPVPEEPLPFPALVVASRNDPYVNFDRARHFARRWGAELVDLGARGHINAESDLGDWPEGRALLDALVARAVPA
jgi:predicted alpha/beta hydrolase family esterase